MHPFRAIRRRGTAPNGSLKILFVGLHGSVHPARWIGQLEGLGWDLHFFPSGIFAPSPADPRGATVHPWPEGNDERAEAMRLAALIDRLEPDIVHSLALEHGGALVLNARRYSGDDFPPWVVTNWGPAIPFFGSLRASAPRIRAILADCDYLCSDCDRDIPIARELGFRGDVLPAFAGPFALDLDRLRALRSAGPTSARRVIVVKGYQGWIGRALTGIRALVRCADLLHGYSVVVMSPGYEGGVHIAAELAARATGVPFELLPQVPGDQIRSLFGRSRIVIGLSLADGIPSAFVEAMAMGAFPIQSSTACVTEWAQDGEGALFVHPEDSDDVARAIRRALTDDRLVDDAARLNMALVEQRLDKTSVIPKVAAMYREVAVRGRTRRPAAIAALKRPAAGLAAGYRCDPPLRWRAGEQQQYTVSVSNEGARVWRAGGPREVNLGIHFRPIGRKGGAPGTGVTDERFGLPEDLAPGGTFDVAVAVTAPTRGGDYVLRHRMVREGVAWLDQWLDAVVHVDA